MTETSEPLPILLSSREEILRCNRCGFCQATCPVYRVTGSEQAVARGHHAHARGLLEGRIELEEALQPALFECLLCKACVANCFGAVKTHEVMLAARQEYIRRYGLPPSLRFVFRHLLHHPRLMAIYLRAAFLGKRSGAADLAESLRVLRWISPEASAANRLIDETPRQFFVDRMRDLKLSPERPVRRVAYFLSCGYNFALPDVSLSAVQALVSAGCEVKVVRHRCCGLPPYVYGDLEAARSLARKNLEAFRELDVEAIVTECGSCFSFLRSYPSLVESDEAKAFAGKIREFSAFVGPLVEPAAGRPVAAPTATADTSGAGEPGARPPEPLTVTYHDPCHLSRYENVRRPPRELLRRVPGLKFVELPEADWCCGAAGTYNIFHYEQSMQILQRKMENIRSTGASIVATSCPACIIQLRHGAKHFDVPVEVVHVAQLVSPLPSSPPTEEP